jgi:hypothetical protein
METVRPLCWAASKPTRNGFVHLLRETQKPTEGTGLKTPTTYRRNQMAQVTYRGIKYDTDRNRTQQTNKVDLTYRGVRQEKELTSVK